MLRIFASLLTICILSPLFAHAETVNIYSGRKEQLIKPLLDQFEEKTGITVNLVTGDADAIITRIQSEGYLSPADVLLTVDAGRLHRAKVAGLLQPIHSTI
jgi:iron(III) transport system substrate-binding protein